MHSCKIVRPSDFARAYFRLPVPFGRFRDDGYRLPTRNAAATHIRLAGTLGAHVGKTDHMRLISALAGNVGIFQEHAKITHV